MRRGVPSWKWGAAPSGGWTTPRRRWSTPAGGPASMSGPWSTPRRSWATPNGRVATPRRSWSTPDEMGRLFYVGKASFRAGKRSLEGKWGDLGGRTGSSRASGGMAEIRAQTPRGPLVRHSGRRPPTHPRSRQRTSPASCPSPMPAVPAHARREWFHRLQRG